jgi:hypothetical protein
MTCLAYVVPTFNGDLSKWYDAKVTGITRAWLFLYGASTFNRDGSKWYVAKVTDMTCAWFTVLRTSTATSASGTSQRARTCGHVQNPASPGLKVNRPR